MLTEAGRKLHQSSHSLDPAGRCQERSSGSALCDLEQAIAGIEAEALEHRLVVASESRSDLELLPSLIHIAALVGRRQHGWVGMSDMLEEWATTIRVALATDLVMDQGRLTRAIDRVVADLEAGPDPASSLYGNLEHSALAALLLTATRENPVEILYARLAREHQAEPMIPDRDGPPPEISPPPHRKSSDD